MVWNSSSEQRVDLSEGLLAERIPSIYDFFEILELLYTFNYGGKFLIIDSAVVKDDSVDETREEFEGFCQSIAVADAERIAL